MNPINTPPSRQCHIEKTIKSDNEQTTPSYKHARSSNPMIAGSSTRRFDDDDTRNRAMACFAQCTHLQDRAVIQLRETSKAIKKAIDENINPGIQTNHQNRELRYLLNNTETDETLAKKFTHNKTPNATLKDIIGTDILELNVDVLKSVSHDKLDKMKNKIKNENMHTDVLNALSLMTQNANREKKMYFEPDITSPLTPENHLDLWKATLAIDINNEVTPSTPDDIPEILKNDKDEVLKLVKKSPAFLAYASKTLKNDLDVVKAAISSSKGSALKYASDELKKDPEMVKIAVTLNGELIAEMPPVFKNNKEIAITAIKQYGRALRHLPETLKGDVEVVKAAVNQNVRALMYASPALKNNEEVMVVVVSKDPFSFQDLSTELKGNKKVATAAVNHRGLNLASTSKTLQNNEEVVTAAVKNHGNALAYASKDLKNNKKVVMAAVNHYGFALKYASKELQDNNEIVIAAIRQDSHAFKFASKNLQNDKPFVIEAIRQNSECIMHVPPSLKNDADVKNA